MSWLNSLSWKTPDQPAEVPELTVEEHRSLALRQMVARLKRNQSYRVLDLGRASSANLEFFSTFSKKIHFEDLYRTISSFDYLSPEDGLSLDRVFRYLLPFRPDHRFDLVFVWDLINYLNSEEAVSLSRHLARHTARGAMAFAMISTRPLIPEYPPDYSILDHQSLLYSFRCTIKRKCPQYLETDIPSLVPDFRIANSYLLRNGLKEYLLIRK